MRRSSLAVDGQVWKRFDRYEVVGGLIGPAPDANLTTYDMKVVTAEDAVAEFPRAYEEMSFALADVARREDGWPSSALTQSHEDAVARWCTKYGLLGLLHHKARLITLAPRKRHLIHTPGDGDPEPFNVPYQIAYVRTGRGWQETAKIYFGARAPVDADLDLGYGAVATDPAVGSGGLFDLGAGTEDEVFENPKVLTQELESPSMSVRALGDALQQYLPGIDPESIETEPLPPPGSDEFWKMYAEPLDEFVRAIFLLERAGQFLQGEEIEHGTALLEALLAPVGLGVRRRTGDAPAQQMLTPTLLSALAVAVTRAVADGRRVGRCERCGRILFTHKKLRRYCSEEHARAAQNQRARANARMKKEKMRKKRKRPVRP